MVSLLPMKMTLFFLGLLLWASPVSAGQRVSVNRLTVDGFQVVGLTCEVSSPVHRVATDVGSALAGQKVAFDACDPEGGAYRVQLRWKAGSRVRAKVRKGSNRKAKRCIATVLRGVKAPVEGQCSAWVLVGDPAAASAALSVQRLKK